MSFLANLFGYVLNFLYNHVQNYGLAIILFSILLRIILLPLTIKQQTSLKKSNKVQEEIKKLQIKYKNNPEMLNKEVMNVYKTEKVSPFSGCLTGIIQFFIFISVFYLVSRPLTYMKKVDTNLIKDYQQQIVDSGESSNYMEIKVIEVKSQEDERVSLNMNFLSLDLSKVPLQNWKDPKVFIIPALYIVTTFASIKLSTNMMKKKKNESKDVIEVEDKDNDNKKEETPEEQLESMEQVTKSMNYMMPIMSVAIALIAPLGLSLYWFISNTLQLCERLVINFFMKKKNQKEAK
jgi:YidC/Oxa1 family membrane protein insertase